MVVVNAASSSAPFLSLLSGTNRVIITATRSGNEQYFTRFGVRFAEALTDQSADLDKDHQVSLLEAFITGSRRTSEFYDQEGRVVTEHALLDDNGDGLGTQGDWFRGLRAVKKAPDRAAVDGQLARRIHAATSTTEEKFSPEQRRARDQLERALFELRERKDQMGAAEYDAHLESLLLPLAKLYEDAGILKRE
jgi:hypothetical protein